LPLGFIQPNFGGSADFEEIQIKNKQFYLKNWEEKGKFIIKTIKFIKKDEIVDKSIAHHRELR